jgi:putative thioredoxin
MATSVTTGTYIIEVSEQTFATEVLERSQKVPVVVDFWAAWCGPCRMLGPILERLAAEYKGAFILAKVDVDSNPRLAAQFQVQGIPAVKAFYKGRVAGEFTGALPEPQVRKFVEGLVPSSADLQAGQAYEWEKKGQLERAEEFYRAALAEKETHFTAMLGLGRTLLKQGKLDEGGQLLQQVPAGVAERTVADALLAQLEFRREAAGYPEADLQANIAADPNDVASRYRLASLLAVEERYTEALDGFLEVVRRNRKYKDDGARKAMLALFTIMGEDDPMTKTYRQKLANVLF